jgi:HSP20 family molecular chaperone IbpA
MSNKTTNNNGNNKLVSYHSDIPDLVRSVFSNPFDRLFNFSPPSLSATTRNLFSELLDTGDKFQNDEKSYTIEVELPRFKKDEVSVKLDGNVLRITAESKDKNRYSERSYYVGSNIDAANIGAKLEDGVLTVTLPKNPKEQGKVIEIT